MATTRILTIHPNKGKSIASTLSLRIDYIQNPSKTVNTSISVDVALNNADEPSNDISAINAPVNIAHNLNSNYDLSSSHNSNPNHGPRINHNPNHDSNATLNPVKTSTTYIQNPSKTKDGQLIKAYACDPRTVDQEFLLSKKEYEYITGRDQGKRNILAYHIRQSFKPGEIKPELALDIGYELAMCFTKGNHAFIVATHTDKAHIHNHIVFNSTALSHDRKFKEPKHSGMVIRRISDLLCLEHGLSVIDNPAQSKGKNYAKWLGNTEPSWQNKLRDKIDEILPACDTFENFIEALKSSDYTVNDKRKHISVLAPGQKKPTRLNTLKGEYTEDAIKERIANNKILGISDGSGGYVFGNSGNGGLVSDISGDGHADATDDSTYSHSENKSRITAANKTYPLSENEQSVDTAVNTYSQSGNRFSTPNVHVNLLIDIQAKIQEGKGAGYEHWARIFNIKETAKTLLFLRDNGIDSYDDLVHKTSAASAEFSAISKKIKSAEGRLKNISELQKQIGTYGKTRDIYVQYRKSGWSADFYEKHRADITLHRAAKKHFDDLDIKKLPTISSLKQEYAELLMEKKKLYAGYHEKKKNMQELLVARGNAEKVLGITSQGQSADILRSKNQGQHVISKDNANADEHNI